MREKAVKKLMGVPSEDSHELVQLLYKDDRGEPFDMSPFQVKIFDAIFKREHRRVFLMTPTQAGKSEIVSMAVLTRAATFAERWAVIAPTTDKAKIIMGKLIKHLFENEYTMERFKIGEGESFERLRRERSSGKITFNVGKNGIGEVFILSAESHRKGEDMGNALMGYGAANVVLDEAALVEDMSEAKVLRMVGGHVPNDFVVKIGNPFKRNHFYKAYHDPLYHKIVVDYKDVIRERKDGAAYAQYIEEMRQKPGFSILFECKFPSEDEIDVAGWSQLLSEDDIDRAISKEKIGIVGEKRLGNDIARGGANFSTWIMRGMNYAQILGKSSGSDLIQTAGQTIFFVRENKILPENIFVDDVGVGGGVVDYLNKERIKVRAVNAGMQATDQRRFANVRAEMYWRLAEWIKRGGKLNNHEDWYQLTSIKYKPDYKGRIKIMGKDEMRALGIDSPDIADGLALTFARSEHSEVTQAREQRAKKKRNRSASRGLKVSMGGY